MVTYKNIRIKMKNGKTRLQRVQVLANGKYKFVKNLGSKAKKAVKTVRSKSRSSKAKVRKTAKGKFFKNMGITGVAEGLIWGYGGLSILGANNPASLPITRLAQGLSGHMFNRRGKARLMPAIIDLIDLWLVGQFNIADLGKVSGVTQLLKVRPL